MLVLATKQKQKNWRVFFVNSIKILLKANFENENYENEWIKYLLKIIM